MESLTFRAFGLVFRIEVEDDALRSELPRYLPYGWRVTTATAGTARSYAVHVTSGAGRREYVLLRGGDELTRHRDAALVLDSLEREIRWDLAEHARDRIFVHAGVVGRRGRAIVLLGSSGAGKSTLVRALVEAGATYYSDEYAVFDRPGRVHPFATELHLRREGSVWQERRSVESLGGRSGRRPLPVGLVVAARYEPGGTTQLDRLTPAVGVLELLKGTAARSRPEEALLTLERVAMEAPVLVGTRGEAADFIGTLLDTSA